MTINTRKENKDKKGKNLIRKSTKVKYRKESNNRYGRNSTIKISLTPNKIYIEIE